MFANSTAAAGSMRATALAYPLDVAASRGDLVAQLLHLLQDALELVLGAVQLPGQPSDIGSASESEVTQHEVGRVRADPRQAATFSATQREQPTEARLRDELLERCAAALSACS